MGLAHARPTNTFRTSEKRTPLNSEQRTLISPRRTLANTNFLRIRKTDSEATPTKCGRLSTAFVTPPLLDSKTEHYISTIAHRASLSRQRKATERSENATSSRVQQSQITTPTGSIPNAYNRYLCIPGPQRWSHIILMILVLLLPCCY